MPAGQRHYHLHQRQRGIKANLPHAKVSGSVNAGMLEVYEEIEPELRILVEGVLLNRKPDATERLVDLGEKLKGEGTVVGEKKGGGVAQRHRVFVWNNRSKGYSCRRASIGSTLEALIAGTHPASKAIPSSKAAAPTSDAGSDGCSP